MKLDGFMGFVFGKSIGCQPHRQHHRTTHL